MKTLVWLRNDLRMADNPALFAAAKAGEVLPVYILDEENAGTWAPGGARKWWLHKSLEALKKDMPDLVLRRGNAREIVPELVQEYGCKAVRWNRIYEPWAMRRDAEIKAFLKEELGVLVESHKGNLLFEPWETMNLSCSSFKVFTPFWNACLKKMETLEKPLPVPKDVRWVKAESERLEDWGLLPRKPNWALGFEEKWTPGEAGAKARLKDFLTHKLEGFTAARDVPGMDGTSGLSPYLQGGEISVRGVYFELMGGSKLQHGGQADAAKFLAELGWREFCAQLLYHSPNLPEKNWKPAFDAYPWQHDEELLQAWQQGKTGYPFVDAGMRELWATGVMHNRVRMVAASFLIKHLRMDWREGEKWFWDTLVDADLASNAANWQWVAGSGADASPYFRIFNPFGQGEKFDPKGVYVRRWCPELAGLPDEFIHTPWLAPAGVLKMAGVVLGVDYPRPIVDHAAARVAAMEGYGLVKEAGRDE